MTVALVECVLLTLPVPFAHHEPLRRKRILEKEKERRWSVVQLGDERGGKKAATRTPTKSRNSAAQDAHT